MSSHPSNRKRQSAKSNQEKKRVKSSHTVSTHSRPKVRVNYHCESDDEFEVSEKVVSVATKKKKEPEVIDLCESDVSDKDDEIEEYQDKRRQNGVLPELSQAFADLDGEEITDDIFTDQGSPDLTRDQILPGDSDDDEPKIQSPKSSPKEIRQAALLELRKKRKISQARPKGIKREDTGLRRVLRQPTPDSEGFEVYSSEDETPLPKDPFMADNSIPPRKYTQRFIWE